MQSQLPNADEASLHAIDYWQVIKNRYNVIILTFLLVFLTSFVITSVMPKKYKSKALIEVKPIQQQETTLIRTSGLGVAMTRQFMMTQFEIIKASKTLEAAAEKILLTERWGMATDDVVAVLKGIVETNQVRGTDLIEIAVTHTKTEDAQAVASAVYAAYASRRRELETEQRRSQLAAIKSELQTKTDRVSVLHKKLLDIADQAGLVYTETGGTREIQGVQGQVDRSQQQLYDLENEATDISAQLERLLNVKEEDLISVTASLPDVGFRQAYDQLEAAKTELSTIKGSGLGPNHSTVVSFAARIQTMEENLTKRAGKQREALMFQKENLESRLKNMRETADRERDKGTASARETQEFNNAQKQYESEAGIRDNMQLRYDVEKSNMALPVTNIVVHESPKIASRPSSPNVSLNLALGVVVGLLFGVGIAFALELMDTSVKSIEDVENFLKVSVLAVIPRDIGVLHKQGGMSPDAEAYRILRTNIEFNRKNPDDNAITVVSGGAGEGKSTTLVNLAYICAQGGYTTLMIDADLRRPRLHTFFDINNSVGLTNYLTTDLLLEDVILKTPVDNLFFMPSGILPTDAAGILNSRRMSELIQDVKERFDLVLIDSPPILGVSDASVLASEVDLTMIVVQHRKLPRNMLIRVKEAVENVGGHVMGVVLNNVDVRSDSQYQYYTSYYTYYAPTGEEGAKPAPVTQTNDTPSVTPTSNDTRGDDLY